MAALTLGTAYPVVACPLLLLACKPGQDERVIHCGGFRQNL